MGKYWEENLDGAVERGGRELVVIFRVDDDLHHVMRVSLKRLNACPLFPFPQLDRHVI